METEAIAPYSPTTIYGQLTSPFTPKQVTINAHTPYDKVDEETESQVYSRDYFQARPQARLVYELPEEDEFVFGINYENRTNASNSENDNEIPPRPVEVSAFAASQTSSRDIVHNSLKQGYSTAEAIIIRDAQNAYKNSATLTQDPVGALSSRSFRVF